MGIATYIVPSNLRIKPMDQSVESLICRSIHFTDNLSINGKMVVHSAVRCEKSSVLLPAYFNAMYMSACFSGNQVATDQPTKN